MLKIETVTTQDSSSDRFHRRFMVDGRQMVDERCNLDAAGSYKTVAPGLLSESGVPSGVDSALLCQYCFPPTESEDEESTDSV